MLIVEPKAELMQNPKNAVERALHVEQCGRVCYKSEARITDGSDETFIANLIKRGHEAMIEHARVTLHFENDSCARFIHRKMNLSGQHDYLTFTHAPIGYYVSGNMRAWRAFIRFANKVEIPLNYDMAKFIVDNRAFFPDFPISHSLEFNAMQGVNLEIDPWKLDDAEDRKAHTWYSVRFTCDRGVSHEIVRHRPASYAQESTRYCNYSKDQFGGEITVIQPPFFAPDSLPYKHWKQGIQAAEAAYFDLLNDGCTPQEARTVLPNSLKTELIMTATAAEWLHFIELRVDSHAHPQMREVATQAADKLAQVDPAVFAKTVERVKRQ